MLHRALTPGALFNVALWATPGARRRAPFRWWGPEAQGKECRPHRHRPRAHADGTRASVHKLGPLENTPLLRIGHGRTGGDPILADGCGSRPALTWGMSLEHRIVADRGRTFAATHVVEPPVELEKCSVRKPGRGRALPALSTPRPPFARRLPSRKPAGAHRGVVLALPFLPAITHALEARRAPAGRLVVKLHLGSCRPGSRVTEGQSGASPQLRTRGCRSHSAPIRAGPAISKSRLDSATVALRTPPAKLCAG